MKHQSAQRRIRTVTINHQIDFNSQQEFNKHKQPTPTTREGGTCGPSKGGTMWYRCHRGGSPCSHRVLQFPCRLQGYLRCWKLFKGSNLWGPRRTLWIKMLNLMVHDSPWFMIHHGSGYLRLGYGSYWVSSLPDGWWCLIGIKDSQERIKDSQERIVLVNDA